MAARTSRQQEVAGRSARVAKKAAWHKRNKNLSYSKAFAGLISCRRCGKERSSSHCWITEWQANKIQRFFSKPRENSGNLPTHSGRLNYATQLCMFCKMVPLQLQFCSYGLDQLSILSVIPTSSPTAISPSTTPSTVMLSRSSWSIFPLLDY